MKSVTIRPGGALTFIEILITIAIIGIIASISTPYFRKTFANLELENLAKDLYYLARYLNASSIGQGKIYYLDINVERKEFQTKYKSEDEFIVFPGRLGKIYKAPAGVIIFIEPPEKTGVYFYPDGSSDKINLSFHNKYNKKISLIIKGLTGEIQIK